MDGDPRSLEVGQQEDGGDLEKQGASVLVILPEEI